MKPATLGALLWILAIPVFVLGAWAVYAFKANNDDLIASKESVWDSTKVPPAEKWLDYRQSTDQDFRFPSDLRLVTGAQEVAKAKPVVVGPGKKPDPVVPKVDIKAEAEKLATELRAQLMLLYVILIEYDGNVDQSLSSGMFLAKYSKVEEQSRIAFEVRPNQYVARIPMAWESAGLKEAQLLPDILHDCMMVEVHEHAVTFAVNNSTFRGKYALALKEDPEKVKQAGNVDENGYVRVEIKIEKAEENAASIFDSDIDAIVQQAVTFGNGGGGKIDVKGAADAREKAVLEALKAAKEEEDKRAAAANAEIPEETQVDPDGNVEVGKNDMHPEAFQGMEQYGETYLDPDTQKPAGVKISRSLPADDTNIVRRYGGQEGDIIKSINGVAVTDAQSIRGTVRKMRNEKVEVFNVVYLRDGVEMKKTIKAKKTD